MGYNRLTADTYRTVRARVETHGRGDVSYAAKQRAQVGEGLHPLVDPKGYGLIRRSLPRYSQRPDGRWVLNIGQPMLFETRFDTTGSMGANVQLAFDSLPHTYNLLSKVLNRYDVQIINAIFGDIVDRVLLCRSQAEMAEKIAEQLTYMDPDNMSGGDVAEDPEYGIFGGAFLTAAHISGYGLRTYDLTVTDAPSHGHIQDRYLRQVYGDDVYDKVAQNGHRVSGSRLPDVYEIVNALKTRAHAFMLVVSRQHYVSYWSEIYGPEHVITTPTTQHLHYYQALIAGLTEGTLDLQSAVDFLTDNGCGRTTALELVRSVEHIPLGAQQEAENFDRIPLRGAVFENKTDLWPVDEDAAEPGFAEEDEAGDGFLWD
jgi:hypothetical protein